MVRFQWHVEDGLGASVGPGQLVYLRDHGVLQAMVEIEMPGGSGPLEACMNIPQNYNTDSGRRSVVARCGGPPDSRRVEPAGQLAVHYCTLSVTTGWSLDDRCAEKHEAGFLVMRYICHPSASESRRVAVYEKAADVAATSPYARGVTRWVLAGLGAGARVAALAGSRVRSTVAGYVLMSYPLKEEMPEDMEAAAAAADTAASSAAAVAAAAAAADSSGPLLGLKAPVLFVTSSADPLVNEATLLELGPRMMTSDVRSVVLQDVDPHFRTLTGKGPHAATLRAVNAAFHEFLNAASAYRMDSCKLPRIWRGGAGIFLPTATGASAAAMADSAGNGGKAVPTPGCAERPQLQRPACFRPLPLGPPPQAQQPSVQQQQQPAGVQAALPYGLSASAAQALAAQLQQRQAAGGGAAGGGGGGAGNTAQLLAQQMLLQQAAAAAATAAQRRGSDQAEVGPASMAAAAAAKLAAAAAARGGGGAGGTPNQLAGQLAQALADPNAAAQIAAMLLRNSAASQHSQQQQQILQLQLGLQQAGGGGADGPAAAGRGAAAGGLM
ncbi:hypothetical protein VOLCADRAFT_98112, partial [Volvox carteri f. nagariensis]